MLRDGMTTRCGKKLAWRNQPTYKPLFWPMVDKTISPPSTDPQSDQQPTVRPRLERPLTQTPLKPTRPQQEFQHLPSCRSRSPTGKKVWTACLRGHALTGHTRSTTDRGRDLLDTASLDDLCAMLVKRLKEPQRNVLVRIKRAH